MRLRTISFFVIPELPSSSSLMILFLIGGYRHTLEGKMEGKRVAERGEGILLQVHTMFTYAVVTGRRGNNEEETV
ncbi:MAG TPA: hypothetical protein PK350_11315 [Deltaproteobacteria bacterium]|nr:hypothetical protein [Deltaproteobacteria bacterium]HPR54800.1 hypothetical protein [Deltaproteobacteria bacterium]